MGKQSTLAHSEKCFAPEINKLITAYCFGHTGEKEREALEVHLFECDYCWNEVQRLEAAVHTLTSEPSLMRSLSAGDFVNTFGISARTEHPFGGHLWHVLISCFLYAGLYAVTFLIEIAYQFDKYGPTALKLAPLAFLWILATSLLALWIGWRRSSSGRAYGLAFSVLIFLVSAGVLYAGMCLFLPASPVTEQSVPSSPAQAAYLKDIRWSLLLMLIFLAPTFHFVVAMQRELFAGRYRSAVELLTGGRFSVTPQGTIFPRFWMLIMALIIMAAFSAYFTTDLFGHLSPSPYKNLFTNLIELRLILHYGLALKCLSWYHRALDDLKRECLVAEKTKLS
jgi:hypothetical protein